MSRNLEISTAYVRLVLRAELLPADRMLNNTGLNAQSIAAEDFIPWQTLALIFRNIDAALYETAWAAQLGARFDAATHGPLGFAALSAPTLGEALELMGVLYPARSNCTVCATARSQGRFFLYLHDSTGDARYFRWMSEIIMKVLETLVAAILGHCADNNVTINFMHPPPADAEKIRASYDARVEFAASENSFSIPDSWYDLPSPLYDEPVYRANIIRCREVIAAREQQHDIVATLSNLLNNHFDEMMLPGADFAAPPTLQEIAASMHVSSRTLIRKLKAENCNYKALLQDIRKARAETLLKDARYNVSEVAHMLGYEEAANFARAFKRWHKVSPNSWRRQR